MPGQRADRRGVVGGRQDIVMALAQYQTAICEEWFTTTSAFLTQAMLSPVSFPPRLVDSTSLRGVLLANHFGLVHKPSRCSKCGGNVRFSMSMSEGTAQPRMRWYCASGGRKHGHTDEAVRGLGVLANTSTQLWPAVFHFILLMRKNERWSLVEQEIEDAYGLANNHTLHDWKHRFQWHLKARLIKDNAMVIGGPGSVVVWDETIVGVHRGVNTGSNRDRSSPRSREAVSKRIARTLPARTVWKRRRSPAKKRPSTAVVCKKPAGLIAKKPAWGKSISGGTLVGCG